MSNFGASVLVSNYCIFVKIFSDNSSILELFFSLSAAALSMSVLFAVHDPGLQ